MLTLHLATCRSASQFITPSRLSHSANFLQQNLKRQELSTLRFVSGKFLQPAPFFHSSVSGSLPSSAATFLTWTKWGSKKLEPISCNSSSAFSRQSRSCGVQQHGAALQLQLGTSKVEIPWLWLRDHCRCESCYNPSTFQKNVDNYSLDNLSLRETKIEGNMLTARWQDGHLSQYSLQWLEDKFAHPGCKVERFLWDAASIAQNPPPKTSYDQHMNSDEGLRNTLSNIIKYGFCLVEGAPASEEGMELVSQRISFLLETVYGVKNTMVSGQLDHSDTAYTSLPLGAHTDTTYFTIPAGIQVFHMIQHDGEGGETLLVDGFNAAEKLRRTNLAYFNTLATTVIPHEYIEGSHYHLYSLSTVLSTDIWTGDMTQIRFNPYDRAVLTTVAPEAIDDYYASYSALTNIIKSKESELWIKLRPGTVLLVDNWRVMHGRSGFTGTRALCGCYLPRDDWTSCARTMGLL